MLVKFDPERKRIYSQWMCLFGHMDRYVQRLCLEDAMKDFTATLSIKEYEPSNEAAKDFGLFILHKFMYYKKNTNDLYLFQFSR